MKLSQWHQIFLYLRIFNFAKLPWHKLKVRMSFYYLLGIVNIFLLIFKRFSQKLHKAFTASIYCIYLFVMRTIYAHLNVPIKKRHVQFWGMTRKWCTVSDQKWRSFESIVEFCCLKCCHGQNLSLRSFLRQLFILHFNCKQNSFWKWLAFFIEKSTLFLLQGKNRTNCILFSVQAL